MNAKRILFILLSLFSLAVCFSSCATTRFYNTRDVEIVSEEETFDAAGNPDSNSIHYIEKNRTVKSTCKPDAKLMAFYTFGLPWVVLGCTVRETAKVVGYSALNVFAGSLAYYRSKNSDDNSWGFILPNTKEEKEEYQQLKEEYENSDLYKYKKYRKPLTKAEITDNIIEEEVSWNDERKIVSSTTNTVSVRTSVSDSAKRVSKKASVVGGMVGSVTSIVCGIPSWIFGFFAALIYDKN